MTNLQSPTNFPLITSNFCANSQKNVCQKKIQRPISAIFAHLPLLCSNNQFYSITRSKLVPRIKTLSKDMLLIVFSVLIGQFQKCVVIFNFNIVYSKFFQWYNCVFICQKSCLFYQYSIFYFSNIAYLCIRFSYRYSLNFFNVFLFAKHL